MLEFKWLTKEVVERLPSTSKRLLFPIPKRIIEASLGFSLNRIFRDAIARGELGFLEQRIARISVTDLDLSFCLTLVRGCLQVVSLKQEPDVTFSAKQCDLLLLASGKMDPDTLFFRRRLAITGDTDLALALKYFLDSQDSSSLLSPPIHRVANHLADAIYAQQSSTPSRTVAGH